MSHPHLCPVCKKAFNCVGKKCGEYNGVPHLQCAPTNRFARMTVEVCQHDWQEQPGEPPIDVCPRCGETRR